MTGSGQVTVSANGPLLGQRLNFVLHDVQRELFILSVS